MGVDVNRVEGRPRELSLEEIENTLDTIVISVIEECDEVKEALAYEVPFVTRYPRSKVSNEVVRLSSSLIGREYYVEEEGLLTRIWNRFTGFFRR